jgi:GDP/UDP-N,N'-diacetylbacillosamine 2-epimerase (hydrolysing)
MKKRKICVVTTSRADYGLLYWLLKEIVSDKDMTLQLIATGMHLSPEFGLSYQFIEKDGFNINKKIETTLSADTNVSIIKSIGLSLVSFSDALKNLNPEILVILGDKYELLGPAISALMLKIPIAHIHGGEISQGAIDESIRHSITKMAAIHFPVAEIYRKRIIQMGENPEFVYNFGAPGVDNIYKLKLFSKRKLENYLKFNFNNTAIVTYHPATLENISSENQIENIFQAISDTEINAIFTQANADTKGRIINQKIIDFCNKNEEKYKYFTNLGQVVYLSCLKYSVLMVGNSSSGLIEAPEFELPVVNIGDRQKGREKASNIIDVDYQLNSIKYGIKKALSKDFRLSLKKTFNPYSNNKGNTSKKIKEKLKTIELNQKLIKKEFFDIN